MGSAIHWELLVKLIFSLIIGLIIGLERETENKPAGVRTHMLVALSATSLVFTAKLLLLEFQDSGLSQNINTDPLRVIEAIVVGISFIGAGTIIKNEERFTARNLSTAASILFTAVLGILVSVDLVLTAFVLSFAVAFINRVIGLLEEKYLEKKK